MEKDGLSHALYIDKNNIVKNIKYEDIKNYDETSGLLWVHFDYSSKEAYEYISEKNGLDPIVVEALLTQETRPRTTVLDDCILLALRGVNLHANSDPEDMISIRLFISQNLIISTKKRDLLSVEDILQSFKKNKGFKTSCEFLIMLTDRLTSRMEGTIANLQDSSSEVEETILDTNSLQLRTQISKIRRETISLRRYLSPQKEAMYKLFHDKISWIDEYDKIQLREITDQLIRYIEELDSINDKLTLIQEESLSKISEQMNQRMYVLSIISAIFLPLGFLTGLLGINVGGVPGVENQYAFAIFSGTLVFAGFLQYYFLKKFKWI